MKVDGEWKAETGNKGLLNIADEIIGFGGNLQSML